MGPPGPAYRPRGSLDTLLHRVVRDHLDEFLQLTRERYDKPLPRYVVREFQEYLRCGDLSRGLVRTACPQCGHVLLVPFSCKRRGLCPSCAGRRMSNTAAHLTDLSLAGSASEPGSSVAAAERDVLGGRRAFVVGV